MAQQVKSNLDLQLNQIINLRLEQLAVDPASPVNGRLWYNTLSNQIKYFSGGIVTTFGSLSGPTTSIDGNLASFNGTNGQQIKDSGKSIANLLDRSNHTGTQLVATMSDFDTAVKSYRLDQFAVPVNPVNVNNQRITNLAQPSNPTDAARLADISSVTTSNRFQDNVNAIVAVGSTTAPGVGLPVAATGQRYIIQNAASLHANWGTISGMSNNCIVQYSGSWVVVYDVAAKGPGGLVWDSNTAKYYQYTGVWAVFGAAVINAGNGLSLSGSTISAVADSTSNSINVASTGLSAKLSTSGGLVSTLGTLGGLGVNIDNASLAIIGNTLQIKSGYKAQRLTAAFSGDGSNTQYQITHNLGTTDYIVGLYNATDYTEIFAGITHGINTVTITFSAIPQITDSFKLVIITVL